MFRALATCAVAVTLITTGCTTTTPANNPSDSSSARTGINADADSALAKLAAQDPSSVQLVRRARGVLIFPSVVSAGFVVGGSYGKGVLRVGGRTEGYYSTTAGSVGLLAGAESKAVFILFMTDDALNKFRNSDGWTAGADASVSVLEAGASVNGNTDTVQKSVVGYVLNNAGLMANLSIDGTKIRKISM